MRFPWISLLVAAVALSSLTGCAGLLGVQGGAAALVTPRGNTPVVATLNAHAAIGPGKKGARSAVVVGPEINLRATKDYGHGDFGFTLAGMLVDPKWIFYTRAALNPVGVSWPKGVTTPAFGTGVEIGGGWSWKGSYDRGRVLSDISGSAVTLSLRGDIEARPEERRADIFIALKLGVAFYGVAAWRN